MALDPTARESNVRDSIKKYFRDALERVAPDQRVPVTFDKHLKPPVLQGQSVSKWVSVNFGDMERGTLSSLELDVYCCTRKDNEGFQLAHLSDKVLGLLSDTSPTASNTMKKIPFYQSKESGEWELIGGIVVVDVWESGQMTLEDETKVKHLLLRLRFASKI